MQYLFEYRALYTLTLEGAYLATSRYLHICRYGTFQPTSTTYYTVRVCRSTCSRTSAAPIAIAGAASRRARAPSVVCAAILPHYTDMLHACAAPAMRMHALYSMHEQLDRRRQIRSAAL